MSRETTWRVSHISLDADRWSGSPTQASVVHIHDTLEDPEYLMDVSKLREFRTQLGVPFLREDVPIGVIALIRRAVRPFNNMHISQWAPGAPYCYYLQQQLRQQPPPEIQWWPVWGASQAYAVKCSPSFGCNPNTDITRLTGMAERLPVFALSYLADALSAINDCGPRYDDVVRRLNNGLRIEAYCAHVEEVDDASLVWLWNSNVRATGVVLDGLSRRRDDPVMVAPLVRWLLAARTNGRWGTTHENAMALEALVSYDRAFDRSAADDRVGQSRFHDRGFSDVQRAPHDVDRFVWRCRILLKQVASRQHRR